jgi:protein-disulfide isomerase
MRVLFLLVIFCLSTQALAEDLKVDSSTASDAVVEFDNPSNPQTEQLKNSEEYNFDAFVLRDIRGNELVQSDLNGKDVVLFFWSIYCSSCMDLIKEQERTRALLATKNIQFVSVHLFEDDPQLIEKALLAVGATGKVYTVIDKTVQEKLSIQIIPSLLFFNKKQQLSVRFDGIENIETFNEMIETIMKKVSENETQKITG